MRIKADIEFVTWTTKWTPTMHAGRSFDDPRDEALWWADQAIGEMVAVPVSMLKAAAMVYDCGDSRTLTSDEDGPLPEPVEIICRRVAGHSGDHSNGYASWDRH